MKDVGLLMHYQLNMTFEVYRDFTVNTESGICIHLIAEDFLFQCAIKTDIYKVCKSDLILIKNGIGGFLLMSIRRGQVSPLGYIL